MRDQDARLENEWPIPAFARKREQRPILRLKKWLPEDKPTQEGEAARVETRERQALWQRVKRRDPGKP